MGFCKNMLHEKLESAMDKHFADTRTHTHTPLKWCELDLLQESECKKKSIEITLDSGLLHMCY